MLYLPLMEIDLDSYDPGFRPFNWSEVDRSALDPFATNLDGLVTVIKNLPPEIVGALCSRASRAQGSLLEVLLNEYLAPILNGEDKNLAQELKETIEFLRKGGFKNILNNQRAQKFYAKWLSQYGDDSIAQMTGAHVVFWGVSQVAMKFMEDRRVGLEPIEKSTRYVNYGQKTDGRYLYYVPAPDLDRLGLREKYVEVMDGLFDTYNQLLPQLIERLKKDYDEKESILEKKAFDALRGLLPMATLSQVAFRGNAQAFEYLLNRMVQHPLGEFRWIARELKAELDKEIPSLLLRIGEEKSSDYQRYLTDRSRNVGEFVRTRRNAPEAKGEERVQVRLVEWDESAEEKILASIIFPETHGTWDEARAAARGLSPEEKEELMKIYLGPRSARWMKTGRSLENAYVRFEITMDIGAYRDLHRHRMMTQERQRFSARHGYAVPSDVKDAGFGAEYAAAVDRAIDLFGEIEAKDPDLAQYVVPLACRVRFYQWQNLRQFFWEAELRTISQGHPDYRVIEQKKFDLLREKYPLLARFALVDLNDYPIARRGIEDRIAEKEKRILDQLSRNGGA